MRGLKRLMEFVLGALTVREANPGDTAVVPTGQTASKARDTGLMDAILLFGTGVVVPGKKIWLAGLLQTPPVNPSGHNPDKSPLRNAASGTSTPACGWLPCWRMPS